MQEHVTETKWSRVFSGSMMSLNGKTKMKQNFRYLLSYIILSVVLTGCGTDGETGSDLSGDGVQAFWTSAGLTNPIDTGSGTVLWPVVAREPGAGGTALSVWVEETDLDPFDSYPAVYHLYARWFNGSDWASTDAGCPAGSGADDGICVVDTGSAEFGAWSQHLYMDDSGNAILLWNQTGCLANPTGGVCNDYENGDRWVSNIYARRFSGGSWSATAEEIDAGNASAFQPRLSLEPDGGGTAVAVWEQRNGTTWSIYARRLTGGIGSGPWDTSDVGICPAGSGADDGICLIDRGVGPAHKPRVAMNNAGNAIAVFIQFANSTCYFVPTGRTIPVGSFACPHNRLFYRRLVGGTWDASATDFTPPTSLSGVTDCFDYIDTTGEGPFSCDCGCVGRGCDCDCSAGGGADILNSSCRAFSDCRLAMDRSALASATVVYKSVEWSLVPDGSGTGCDCSCGAGRGGDCSCDCDGGPSSGTETYQQIRVEAWRNTGGAGTTDNLANYSYLGPSGSSNCSSINPSDGDDNRVILNCDLDSPTVDVEPDGGGTRIALWERYDGSTRTIRSRRFSGSWLGDTFVAGGAGFPTVAPQIAMDDAGNGLAVFVQFLGDNKWHVRSNTYDVGTNSWLGNVTVDSVLPSEDGYFNPVVAMDGPGAALSLLIGFTEGFGFTLYGVTGP
jgi:hypothetical protein